MSVRRVQVEAIDGAWSCEIAGDLLNTDLIAGIAIGKFCAACQRKLIKPQDSRVALCAVDSAMITAAIVSAVTSPVSVGADDSQPPDLGKLGSELQAIPTHIRTGAPPLCSFCADRFETARKAGLVGVAICGACFRAREEWEAGPPPPALDHPAPWRWDGDGFLVDDADERLLDHLCSDMEENGIWTASEYVREAIVLSREMEDLLLQTIERPPMCGYWQPGRQTECGEVPRCWFHHRDDVLACLAAARKAGRDG